MCKPPGSYASPLALTLLTLLTLGLLAPAAPTAAASASRSSSFTVATHNQWRSAARHTALADVIGWQEVDRPRELRRALPRYQHFIPGPARAAADSISWRPSKFALVSSGYERTHGGLAHVSPPRYFTWVKLRLKATGKVYEVVNTHLVSGAFKRGTSARTWRVSNWYDHRTELRDFVARQQADGQSVIVTGDFNSTSNLRLPGTRRAPHRGRSIDQIYVDTSVRTSRAHRLGRYGSDHHAWRARIG